MNTLKAMEKLELIKLYEQTGQKVSGLYTNKTHIAYYIDDWGKMGSSFEYKCKKYQVKFFNGCFMPYVVLLDDEKI